MYDLHAIDLTSFKAMVVHDFSTKFIYINCNIIENFLNEKKIVIWRGHLTQPWLPGCALFEPKNIHAFSDFEVTIIGNAPEFFPWLAEGEI